MFFKFFIILFYFIFLQTLQSLSVATPYNTSEMSQWLRLLHLYLISSTCIFFVHHVLKYSNNETLTDGEWQNVETEIVHDILMKFHRKHRDWAGREVGHVVDQIVIQERQQTRETL